MPTLVLMRHATAISFAASDHDRALTDQGRADAAAAGRTLASLGVTDPVGYVSAARRTRETWAEVATAAGWQQEATYDSSLYAAGEDGVLELLWATPAEIGTVAVIGHNPTMGALAQLLDDGAGRATSGPIAGFPTAAFGIFDVDNWDALGPMAARLEHYGVGRA